jgi:hypothetical protein
MSSKLAQLTDKAKEYMRESIDPIHDLGHVTRVVENIQKIATDMNCSVREKQILELAGWWHDVGRAVIKKPSMWMIFFDDIISALALLSYAIRFRNLNRISLTAIRILICHSFASGTVFTKFLLGSRGQILRDILADADSLDLLHLERFELMRNFCMLSVKNEYMFRFIIWMSLHTTITRTKTKAAQKYLHEVIMRLLDWVTEQEIYLWHVAQFGEAWVRKTIHALRQLSSSIKIAQTNA